MLHQNNTEPVVSVASIQEARQRRVTEPQPTSEEIREWRDIRPHVLQMLREWDTVRTMCPLARKILHGE